MSYPNFVPVMSNVGTLSIHITYHHYCLVEKNIRIVRLYCGSFVTSLDMAGFQISLLNVSDNCEWVDHLDRETNAPGWHGNLHSVPLADSSNLVKVARCDSGKIRKVQNMKIPKSLSLRCSEILSY